MNSKLLIGVAILFVFLLGCYGKPPTPYGKALLNRIEIHKTTSGGYPKTIKGNLVDSSHWNITTNSFFYILDSSRDFFTLKVYLGDGLSDLYDSKSKQWIRS